MVALTAVAYQLSLYMQEQHFPFINCIEKFVLAHEPTAWDACYENTSLNMKLVGDCYESGYGKKVRTHVTILIGDL